jgi:hypothetical protein
MGTERQMKRARRVARKFGIEVVETSEHFQSVLTPKQIRRVKRTTETPRVGEAAPVIGGKP